MKERVFGRNKKGFAPQRLAAFAAALMLVAGTLIPAATVQASEGNWPVDTTKTDCTITLNLSYKQGSETKKLADGEISIFQVATVKEENGYSFDVSGSAFAEIEGVSQIPEMDTKALAAANNELAQKMEKAVAASSGAIKADDRKTVAGGQVKYTGLTPGLYLVCQTKLSTGDRKINAFLISIPDANGQYDVVADPKSGIYTPPETTVPPTKPQTPPSIPQTGQLWWPVPLLAFAGAAMILVGVVIRSRSQE